jgi:hypothetical protein
MTGDRQQPNGDMVSEKEEWKYRAPYKIHDTGEGFETKYEGGCHCGKVQFQLRRDAPLASKLCHCTTCQSQHGTYSLHFPKAKRTFWQFKLIFVQPHLSNGPQSFTRRTLISVTATMISNGMIQHRRAKNTNFLAK